MEIESQAHYEKQYKRLIGLGFEEKVANYVAGLQKEGMIADDEWDTKAMEALKTLPANAAISLLENLKSSNYRNAINKSAYLFSAIKAQRQRLNGERTSTPTSLANGLSRNRATSNSEYKNQRANSDSYSSTFYTGMAIKRFNGSHSNNSRTNGYYPEKGCEIVCRNVSKSLSEDDILTIMEKIGTVWDVRIINRTHLRGGAFPPSLLYYESQNGLTATPSEATPSGACLTVYATFMTKAEAERAINELNGYKIQGVPIKVQWSASEGPRRLQLFNFDHERSKAEVFELYTLKTPGLVDVIYKPATDLCLLEYETHSLAELALEKLNEELSRSCSDEEEGTGAGDEATIMVDWARSSNNGGSGFNGPGGNGTNSNSFNATYAYYEAKPHEIKALHVRNLTEQVGEEALKEMFERYGKLERVKKVRTFAFVHYQDPLNALHAMRELNNKHFANTRLQITVAKKPFNVVSSSTTSTGSCSGNHSNPGPEEAKVNGHGNLQCSNVSHPPSHQHNSHAPKDKDCAATGGCLHRGYSFSNCSSKTAGDIFSNASARAYGPRQFSDGLVRSAQQQGFRQTGEDGVQEMGFWDASRSTEVVRDNTTKQYLGSTTDKLYHPNQTAQKPANNDLTPPTNHATRFLPYSTIPAAAPPTPPRLSTLAQCNGTGHAYDKQPKPPLASAFKISKLQPVLDSVKEPLMGLKYITEFHSYINGVLTTTYDCSICDNDGNCPPSPPTPFIPHHKIVDHIRSNDHICSYIVKDHGEIWNALVEMAGKAETNTDEGSSPIITTKSCSFNAAASSSMSTFFPMITQTLEAQYGRQKINVKHDPIYQPRSYSSAVLDGGNEYTTQSNHVTSYQVNRDHNVTTRVNHIPMERGRGGIEPPPLSNGCAPPRPGLDIDHVHIVAGRLSEMGVRAHPLTSASPTRAPPQHSNPFTLPTFDLKLLATDRGAGSAASAPCWRAADNLFT